MLLDRNETKTPFVLIALNTGDVETELKILASQGLKAKPMLGCYKGEQEQAYLVPFGGVEQMQAIVHVAKQYKQESILVCDSDRKARLYYVNDGEQIAIGSMKRVTETEAKQSEAYTLTPEGAYWLAKK